MIMTFRVQHIPLPEGPGQVELLDMQVDFGKVTANKDESSWDQ